jgi:hypothetical protein
MEAYALSAKATKLAGVQDEKRPEALLASGHGEVAAQLSQLKGQMNAIEQAIIDKKCAIQRSAPPATK